MAKSTSRPQKRSTLRKKVLAPVDLLPFRIVTRKRGSNNMALVVFEASQRPPPQGNEIVLAAPRNEEMDPAGALSGLELALYEENRGWDAMDLPLKKRLMFIRSVAHERNQFICHVCGQVYSDHRALGGHKAQHTIEERKRKRKRPKEENGGGGREAMVVYVPPKRRLGPHPNGSHRCAGCERVFPTTQGLGGHRQHCRGRPAPPARRVHDFDLNELPPEGEDGGCMLALPWYGNDGN